MSGAPQPGAQRRETEAALLGEVKHTAHVLSGLMQHASHLDPDVVAKMRATFEKLAGPAPSSNMVIALVGEATAAKRGLLNAFLGEEVLATAAPKRERVTTVVRASAFDYKARYRDGRVVEFSVSIPDREGLFAKSLAQAEQEVAAERAAKDKRNARLAEMRTRAETFRATLQQMRVDVARAADAANAARQAATAKEDERVRRDRLADSAPVPAFYRRAPPWWALWLWILRLVLRPFLREPLRLHAARETEAKQARAAASASADAAASASKDHQALEDQHKQALDGLEEAERAAASTETELRESKALEQATLRIARLRDERDKYAAERKAAFLKEVRAFDEESTPATAPSELVIEYPTELLPAGLAIMDTPSLTAEVDRVAEHAWNTVRHDADAFVVVREAGRLASEEQIDVLRGALPLVLDTRADRARETLTRLSKRLDGHRTLIRGAHSAMRLRGCVAELLRAQAAAQGSHRKRLAALEAQRIVDPAEFRARQMTRAEGAIEQAATDVLRSATELVRAGVERIRAERKAEVEACKERAAVEACVAAINVSVPPRITELLERTTEHIARELHDATETLETWALEEIHARYQIARRLGAEIFSPVASDVSREDLEGQLRAALPIEGAVDAFEKKRVGMGLGGAAAGAVIGTFILPGIGTAVGAFLGVFAGFLKGLESLKQECIVKLDACMSEAQRQVEAQLAAKKPDIARAIRMSLDEALEQALARLEDAIARLVAVERKAITAEQTKLKEIDDARVVLEEHDARLARLIDAASAHFFEHVR